MPIPVIYFPLLDTASITPDVVINRHAKVKEKGAWIPFKICTTKVAETLHATICGLWFCAQFGKSSETLSIKDQRFYIQRLHILGSHKQHVNSKEWEPLRDSKMKFGVRI